MDRPGSSAQSLRSIGLSRLELLDSAELRCLRPHAQLLAQCADPDEACLSLQRLLQVKPDLCEVISQGETPAERLLSVLGGSRALADYLVSHPNAVSGIFRSGTTQVFLDGVKYDAASEIEAVAADGAYSRQEMARCHSTDEIRRTYRQILLGLVADDLTHPNPRAFVSVVGRRLAALVDATWQAALEVAYQEVDPNRRVKLSVIAMGKTGAQELNYISDVDVMYVVAANDPELSEAQVVEIGTRLATAAAAVCAGAGMEPPLWPVDTGLRPEGKQGALVRTLESYRTYYERWAKSWEFQALLKARPCAGDEALGQSFMHLVTPLVWKVVERSHFVEETRAMRLRVEQNIPSSQTSRHLKLGPGGLRDVEFTAQLLQLVHGRTDESVRVPHTLQAIDSLSAAGYVGREGAAQLRQCYRFLRLLEHRAQLFRMQRTHIFPDQEASLRRIGRSLGQETYTPKQLEAAWQETRLTVRHLHEELFYRPLLPAMANLDVDQVELSPHAAQVRLEAIGYIDPQGALRHIAALSEGISRRAAIQRQLLPVMLGWLADGPNPDAGLLAFRRVSDKIGRSHWYLGLLRDSRFAAKRLCQVLSTSQWAGAALEEIPQAVQWLDDDEELSARSRQQLEIELSALIERHEDPKEAAIRLRAVRYRELTRCALADCLDGVDARRSGAAISDINEATLEALLKVAVREHPGPISQPIALIGMGRFGGKEPGYASDADVICIHEGEDEASLRRALDILGTLQEICAMPCPYPPLAVDMDLRPEGRNGALSRTLASYEQYYSRWYSPWERQALLRARFVAGNAQMGQNFIELIDPLRYGPPPSAEEVIQIRRLKARMETERLPRGYEPKYHVKLGPGGLSDVEWSVQLLQLRYAHEILPLRVTGTIAALVAATDSGVLGQTQFQELSEAWILATRIRAANTLASGRVSGPKLDVLPRTHAEQVQVGRLLGYGVGHERDLEETYLRLARRARGVMEEVFYN